MFWFGVIKKRNGQIKYGVGAISMATTQESFLSDFLDFESGDIVLDLYQSNIMTQKYFKEYVHEKFLKISSKKKKN